MLLVSYLSCYCLVAKSCLILCDPMDCSTPVSSIRGILHARILEGLQFPSPGDFSDLGIEPTSPAWQVDSLPLSRLGSPHHILVIIA